nr:hypothetical protein [Tanacetum cinerariifolium]
MIQTASHLSPDVVENIQTTSLEPGLESSSIFTPEENVVQSSTDLTASKLRPGVSFASLLKDKSKHKGLNFCTLITQAGNKADVAVPLDSICVVKLHGVPITSFTKDGLSVIVMDIDTPLRLNSYTFDMCTLSWGRSSYARALIEIQADVELKDTIVVVMLKLTREGFYTLGCGKEHKKPSPTSRGVSVGSKVGFKPTKEYRLVSKKPTTNSGNKKKGVEPTKEVSNSNPFDVLNLVDYEDELGTNRGLQIWLVTEPILMEPHFGMLKRVVLEIMIVMMRFCSGDNDMACSMVTDTVGFGTKSLLEQWTDSYVNGDYDEDPYDDDLYEGQDLSNKLQDICDNLYIRVL